jgi:hypothetical protein
MNGEEKPNTDQSTLQPPTTISKPKQNNTIPAEPPTAIKLQEVENRMTAFEQSTIRWTRVAVGVSILAAIFICAQWWEMHTGSADTHNLAIAAANQATWTQHLSDNMKIQADRTQTLADRMKDQADQTKTIANQAIIQAAAAKSAADTAKETLNVSERAYLILGVPVDDFQQKRINIPLINSGHIPSGITKVVVHEATFRLDDPSLKFLPFTTAIEWHWRRLVYQTIPVVPNGNLISIEVDLPNIDQDQITTGKQAVTIAAQVTYNDGFPNTPDQTYIFCDQSSYIASTKLFAMRPCDDANTILQALIVFDKYPSPNYQEK